MKIDISKSRQIKHPARNYSSVADDDDAIRRYGLELRAKFGIGLALLRLRDRQTKLKRFLLYGRRCQFHPAALRTIGLGYYKFYLVAGSEEFFERRYCELRSAAEYKFHFHSPAFTSLRILRFIKSRFSPEM